MSDNQGDVALTLDGEPVTLRYTLGAAKGVNRGFGSFVDAMKRIQAWDFSAFVAIVALGLGKTDNVKEVEQAVFNNGLKPLVNPLIDYLGRLSNGGRADDGTDSTKDSTKGEG